MATCSLTILCFYCPVPYSTLLCLAEFDEHLPFKTDQQHLYGLYQLIFTLKLNVYFLLSIWCSSRYNVNSLSRHLYVEEQMLNAEALVLYVKMHVRISAGKPEKAHS